MNTLCITERISTAPPAESATAMQRQMELLGAAFARLARELEVAGTAGRAMVPPQPLRERRAA